MIGKRLAERYEISAELGRGGMGVVYRARDTLLERDVALKLVTEPGLGTEGRNRLLAEARATAALSHRNIVSVYDVGETRLPGEYETSSFIVMEQVEGTSLRKRMPTTLDGAVEIGRQICAALQAAHARGIIHGDLKPENILLTPDGEARLMDFGLAQSMGAGRAFHEPQIAGTVGYLAPEVISGEQPSVQSDLYALGVLLYEMVTGRPVFESDELTGLLAQHLIASVVLPSVYNQAIPETLESVIVQLLRKRPENRPVSVAKVASVLASWREPDTRPATRLDEFTLLDRMARGRLIGRQREYQQAKTLWETVKEGRGRFLLVTGEPGIGKTRLVRELMTLVEVSGGIVLTSASYESGGLPYGAVSQLVQAAFSRRPRPRLQPHIMSVLLNLAPTLKFDYPALPEIEVLDPQAEQFRLYECVLSLFRRLAQDGPVMLFIDDLHWADSGTLSLLEYLARHIVDEPILLVGTYREIELAGSPALQRLLEKLTQERLAIRLKLPRLSRAATADLLAALLVGEVSPEFADAIYRETEGNPFFVEEVCKALAENGRIQFEDGHWRKVGQEELEIPQGAMVAIQRRLDRFSADEQNILQMAAMIGREFDYSLLQAAASGKASFVEKTLDHALKAQLIEEIYPTDRSPSEAVFAFAHALIHGAILASLGTFRRQRMQRRVALALETAYGDNVADIAPLLGRYFGEAGDAEKAARYLVLAGDEARRVYAYRDAVKAYEQALLFLEELDQTHQEARARIKLGLSHQNLFEFEAARTSFERGFALWQRPDKRLAKLGNGGRVLRLHLHEPRTLDPARAGDGVSETYARQMFRGLVELGPDGEVWPDLADSWEILDGGSRYLFHLRDDGRWSDDQPVTAHDFEKSWKRALAPEMGEDPASSLYDIRGASAYNQGKVVGADSVGVQALDDFTLLVELEGPVSYFLQLLTRGVALSTPQHAIDLHGDDWTRAGKLVVNGPFKLESWKAGQEVVLSWNQSYRGRIDGNLQRIVMIADPEAPILALYEGGDLDVLNLGALPTNEAERAKRRYLHEYVTLPYAQVSYFAFDATRPPFDDSRVRRAVSLATDRALLANMAMQGVYFPAEGGLVPPGIWGHTPDAQLAYDPVEARRLLAEAGYPGGRGLPQVEILTVRRPQRTNQYIADIWQEVLGLRVAWQELWFSDFLERLERQKPHIWFTGWAADYPDPDNFLRICVARERTGWDRPQYAALVEEARRVGDLRERQALYKQAELILAEEAPLVPLFYTRHHMLLKSWVHCYPVPAVGGLSMKDVCVVKDTEEEGLA